MDCVSHRILQREGELETPSVEGRVCVCVCPCACVHMCAVCVYGGEVQGRDSVTRAQAHVCCPSSAKPSCGTQAP